MKKLLLFILLVAFPLLASAQASGGQIRRNVQRTTSKVNRSVSPSRNTSRTYTTREMFEMGKSFYDKGNYTEALNWYKKAAENGSSDAQSELGFMYMNGEGTPVNKSEGARWLIKAGENGDAMAQRALGFMYRNGDGVPKNETKAKDWLDKAAPKFYEAAKKLIWSNGNAAIQLFASVIEMDVIMYSVWSMYQIGAIYYHGDGGVESDNNLAYQYFKMASDKGNMPAHYYVGMCYLYGYGVPKDSRKGNEYLEKSGYQRTPPRNF